VTSGDQIGPHQRSFVGARPGLDGVDLTDMAALHRIGTLPISCSRRPCSSSARLHQRDGAMAQGHDRTLVEDFMLIPEAPQTERRKATGAQLEAARRWCIRQRGLPRRRARPAGAREWRRCGDHARHAREAGSAGSTDLRRTDGFAESSGLDQDRCASSPEWDGQRSPL
jgi:hypothetical protein